MNDFPDDYIGPTAFVEQMPHIKTRRALEHDIKNSRDDYRAAGVLVEVGNGTERFKLLLSPSRYTAFWRKQTQQRAGMV